MGSGKFGAKEVMDVTLYDIATGDPVIYFNTLKTSDIEFTSEKVHAKGGRGNSKLITWEIEKEGTLTIEDALISKKSLELVSGLAAKTGAEQAYMRQATEYDKTGEYPVDKGDLYPLTATATGAIELAYTPDVPVTQIKVYEAEDGGYANKLSMASATLSGTTLTVPDAKNKQVVVFYTYQTEEDTETFIIDSAHFAGTYRLVGDTVVRNLDNQKDETFQIQIPNLKWASNLKLNFSAEGDPEPTSFECDILRSANSSQMIKMIKKNGH